MKLSAYMFGIVMLTSVSFAATAAASETCIAERHHLEVDLLHKFANGNLAGAEVAFVRKRMAVVSGEDTHTLLAKPVDALGVENFTAASRVLEFVASGGKLSIPAGGAATPAVVQARDELQRRFETLVAMLRLRHERNLPQREIEEVREALADWRVVIEPIAGVAERGAVERFHLAMSCLLDRLSGTDGRILAEYLINDGHRFSGGCVADLVKFVITRQAPPKPGSEASRICREVARALEKELRAAHEREIFIVESESAKRRAAETQALARISPQSLARTGSSTIDVPSSAGMTRLQIPSPTIRYVPTTRTYTIRRYYVVR